MIEQKWEDAKRRQIEDMPAVNPEDPPEDVKQRMQKQPAAGRTPKRKPTVQEQATELFMDALAGSAVEQLFRAERKGQLDWEIKGSFSGGLLLQCHVMLTMDAEQEDGDSQDVYKKALAMVEAIRPYLAAEYRQLEAGHGRLWTMRELMTPDTREATDLDMHMVTAAWLTETPLGRCCQAAFEAMREADRKAIISQMETQRGPMPDGYTMAVGSVMKKLSGILETSTAQGKDIKHADDFRVKVSDSRHALVETTVSAALKDLEYGKQLLIEGRPFTEIHEPVFNAVMTLAMAGRRTFSAVDIDHVITGRRGGVSKARQEEISRLILDMRHTEIRIDANAEVMMRTRKGKFPCRLYSGEIANGFKGGGAILELRDKEFDSVATAAYGWEITTDEEHLPSVLMEYVYAVRQLTTVPKEYLDVHEVYNGKVMTTAVRTTTNRSLIVQYIARCVYEAAGKNVVQGTIRLSTLCRECGLKTSSSALRYTRDYIRQVMEYYEAAGFVQHWDLTGTGTGARITFLPTKRGTKPLSENGSAGKK